MGRLRELCIQFTCQCWPSSACVRVESSLDASISHVLTSYYSGRGDDWPCAEDLSQQMMDDGMFSSAHCRYMEIFFDFKVIFTLREIDFNFEF